MSASNAGQSIKPECSVLPDVSSSNGNSFFWTNGEGGKEKITGLKGSSHLHWLKETSVVSKDKVQ